MCSVHSHISVDVAQYVENFHKFTMNTLFLSATKMTFLELNNLFMARFQLIWMLSYGKNKPQMCSVTQHQCRRRQMCWKFSLIQPELSLFVFTKNDLSWLNNLFMARFQLISMSPYAKNKLQMSSVTQSRCKRRKKCVKNFLKFTKYTHFLSVTKNDLSRLNNLFMARFQLITKSSYAKNKLQMCWVTQHQYRLRHNNVWKIFTNTPSTLTFCLLEKMTCLDWTIYSRPGFNSWRCPIMLRTNYRCVQALNICVNVAKCVKNSPSTLTFCLLQTMTCLDWTIYSRQGFNSLGCPIMLWTNYRCVQSLNISVNVIKFVENFHSTLTFCLLQKWHVLTEQSIHGKVSTH